jgi:hypothetical protein
MSRTIGLARTICRSCGTEQLVGVRELVAGATIECAGCHERESAESVLGRYAELAQLVGVMRDMRRDDAPRTDRAGAAPEPTGSK